MSIAPLISSFSVNSALFCRDIYVLVCLSAFYPFDDDEFSSISSCFVVTSHLEQEHSWCFFFKNLSATFITRYKPHDFDQNLKVLES